LKTAIRYLRAMDTGLAKAQLFECDDGNLYVVKFMNNPQGIRGLPNELICYRLAEMLDLPVPKGHIIYIPQMIIDLHPPLQDLKVQPGLHFGSQFIHPTQAATEEAIASCVNLDKAPGMLVFDNWVHNFDRNKKNVIVTIGNKPKFYMIDHQCCLGGGWWTIKKLLRNCDYVKPIWCSMHPRFVPYIDHKGLQDAIDTLQSLSRKRIREAVVDIPKEWGVTQDELDVLVYYLDKRKWHVVAAIEQLEPLFPKSD
jgi:hypothetical protein